MWRSILIFLFVVLFQVHLKAQSIAWAFNQPIYSTDTSLSKYLHKGVYNLSQLDSAYQRFVFTSNECYGSYSGISTATNISPCAGNAFQLNFSLNNKNSSTYFYKVDTGMKNTAIFVIPGTGNNQSSQILSNVPVNYHNYYNSIYFGLPESCLKHGDMYMYIKPNEDIRAIRNGNFKLSEPNLYPVLTNRGTSYTSNLFIECFAIVKYLKTKYRKVIIYGLSQGGTTSMITSIETDPDAALVCSGYSTTWDTAFYASGPSGLIQDSIFNVYSSDNIKDSMTQNMSYYFYSWGSADVVSLLQEYPFHRSQNKWGNHCNIQYHYGIYNHAIPFVAADTFLRRCIRRPKMEITQLPGQCIADSVKIRLHLFGSPPFQMQMFRDSSFVQNITVNDTITDLTLFQAGTYQFFNITDLKNTPLCKSKKFVYQKSLKPNISWNYLSRDCVNQKDSLKINLQGEAPFSIQWAIPGYPAVYSSLNDSMFLALAKGKYPINQISDASLCTRFLQDTIRIIHDTLKATVDAPLYVCDSLKSKIQLHVRGIFPITLVYYEAGQYKTAAIADTSHILWVGNGNILLAEMTDSAGCQLLLNQVFQVNNQPIQLLSIDRTFHCDSVKEEIQVTSNGQFPMQLFYRKNGTGEVKILPNANASFLWGNGNYQIDSIKDATLCKKAFNIPLVIQHDTLEYISNSPQFICDSLKSKLDIQLEGDRPFTILYNRNGSLVSGAFNNFQTQYWLSNGTYQFLQVSDSNGCVKPMSEFFTLNFDTLAVNFSTPLYVCDSAKSLIQWELAGNGPYQLFFQKNGLNDSLFMSQNQVNTYFENGTYQFQQLNDFTGCNLLINQTEVLNFKTLSFTHTSPIYSCDSSKANIRCFLQGNAPYLLTYVRNGQIYQSSFNQDTVDLYWDNGLYSLISISDATQCVDLISEVFNIQFNPLSAVISNPVYSCDSLKGSVNLVLGGNAPYTFNYLKDGIPGNQVLAASGQWYLNNGQYQLQQVIDSTGCSLNLTQNFMLNFDTLEVQLSNPVYNCDSNKTHLHIDLEGNAPYTLFYTINGTTNQINISLDSLDLYWDNGLYSLISISDATQCVDLISEVFNIQFNPLSAVISNPVYSCDSLKGSVNLVLGGNAPYTFNYLKDGIPGNQVLAASGQWYLNNGQYQLQQVIDSTGCSLNLTQNFMLNFDTLEVQLSNPVYNCDSNKTHLHIDMEGNAPYTLFYTINGTPNQINISVDSLDLYLNNGLYTMDAIKDATNCIHLMNQAFNFQYQPLNYAILSQGYNCDSNQYRIQFQFYGNAPWLVLYSDGTNNYSRSFSNNLSELFLGNGNWTITQIGDANCTLNPGLNYLVNYQPIQASVVSQFYNCDSNKMQVQLNLGGNAPWKVDYDLLGTVTQSTSVTFMQPNPVMYFPKGEYLIQSVSDVTLCQKSLNHYLNQNIDSLIYQKLTQTFDCDSEKLLIQYLTSGTGPRTIHYKSLQTGNSFQATSNAGGLVEMYLQDSIYVIQYIQDAYCSMVISDTIHHNYRKPLSEILKPEVNCVDGIYQVKMVSQGGVKPYTYYYTYNGINQTLTSATDTMLMNLPNGDYFFENMLDATGCGSFLNIPFLANYTLMQYQGYSLQYDCVSDSTALVLNLFATDSVRLWISKNNLTEFVLLPPANLITHLKNGKYIITQISDQAGCAVGIDDTLVIANEPVKMQITELSPHCLLKQHIFRYKLDGLKPWTLNYNLNNQDQTKILNDSMDFWMLNSAYYQLNFIQDSNGCVVNVDTALYLPPFAADQPQLVKDYTYLRVLEQGIRYKWFQNGVFIDSTNEGALLIPSNGVYSVVLTDLNGCEVMSNSITIEDIEAVSLFPNPVSGQTTIRIGIRYDAYWNYAIRDVSGRVLIAGIFEQNTQSIDLSYLSKGQYYLHVQMNRDNEPISKVIKLLKQ